MSKSNAKAWQNALRFVADGNHGAFARIVSGMHRAENSRQQKAIEAAVDDAGLGHLFRRANGALVAA